MTADPGQEDLTADDHLAVDTAKDDPQDLDADLVQPVQDRGVLYADDPQEEAR